MPFLSSCFKLQQSGKQSCWTQPVFCLSLWYTEVAFWCGAFGWRHEGELLFLGSAERKGQRKGHRGTSRVHQSQCHDFLSPKQVTILLPLIDWARIPTTCGNREPFSDFSDIMSWMWKVPECSWVEGLVSCFGLRWCSLPESSDLISGLTHWQKGIIRRSESGEGRQCLVGGRGLLGYILGPLTSLSYSWVPWGEQFWSATPFSPEVLPSPRPLSVCET